ncbi:GvpL/GvpF family gas vesicle protein [Nonomuraea gerenzanensis]|uniref:Gas vesicle synthesis GvpLGvpF n=1 Tax=Nonomuraea gerenzanensis TaxID=93944 RepID=A0A1M4E0E2_9ACTN|nr:GvpL/GvpF family gas vesicle protein [Nonomuraea gerenzanensis]UBU14561.1 GvpL/GvpF family gas vesicle protein [Nonomuraea gerenzanensis]SBO92277.1 Gas vesicle synthesis GvpLGvpF [Nonomuraea gerenzanensis]
MPDLTYLYAVARESLSCPSGVAGNPVRTIARAGLVAYVSSVPAELFGAEPLRRSLEDLDWLGETARAHHRVVDAVAAVTTTAPVRLVTVYEDDAQVAELLERRSVAFGDVLAHVTGRREWGVKAYTSPAAAAAQAADPDHADQRGGARTCGGDGQAGRPGTAYLQRRRAGLRGREQVRRQVLQRADHIHRALSALAAAGRRHRPQDPRLSGRHDWMLLNGAYLVDEARAGEFAALAGELGGDGVEIRVTGPWAPYSFTVMEPA